ncbi:MAG: hypothetical protein A3F67_08800 [Verrucomicrobia bacterium RIFCSPHIGHO2_12_FULL_41_10]|nr:MAG: hypothetical protein A3F67_08800 [Verrucomicrobia bacterium RIFCSPHIGHO2_12_FULL_41_10]HLB34131.1 hypothetical protein [Chthoniobacterales bacterium]
MKKVTLLFLLAVSTIVTNLSAQNNRIIQSTKGVENKDWLVINDSLMMDPVELKNIEEGIEDLRGEIGSPGRSTVSSQIAANTRSINSPSIHSPSYRATLACNDIGEENGTNAFLENKIKEYGEVNEAIAEVQVLAAKPCEEECNLRMDRATALMATIRKKAWPTISQSMKVFSEHPSEAKMLLVRNSSFAYAACASVLASFSSYAASFSSNSEISASISSAAFAFSAAAAYVYLYPSTSVAVSASVYNYDSAFASLSSDPDFMIAIFDYASASASLFASVSASVAACACASISASASEALVMAQIADQIVDQIKLSIELSRKNWNFSKEENDNLDYVIAATRETASYAHAVAKYKTEQEAVHGKRRNIAFSSEWEEHAESVWASATAKNSENFWRNAEITAKEALRKCEKVQNSDQGAILEAAFHQQEYWRDLANLASVKDFIEFCNDNDSIIKAASIMRTAESELGSPISLAMKEFIVHPSEATLEATGKPFLMTMTLTEAQERVALVEIFAKSAADGVVFAERHRWDGENLKRMNRSAKITQEVLEFAQAVAHFKSIQNF